MKVGIYVDAENVNRSGGFGLRYDALKKFGSYYDGEVLRANTYVAVDEEKMNGNGGVYRKKQLQYFDRLRKTGFKLVKKTVKHYVDENGKETCKANADMEMAIDAILQARNLDKIVLVTGDGDFVRLVQGLQNLGCRVEIVGFNNVSRELKETADIYYSGYMIPGLIPVKSPDYVRGYLTHFNEDGKYGYFRTYAITNGNVSEEDIWFHSANSKDLIKFQHDNTYKAYQTIYEFRVQPSKKKEGCVEAYDISESVENVIV